MVVLPAVTMAVESWVEPLGRMDSMTLEERIGATVLAVLDAPAAAVEALDAIGAIAVEVVD